MSTATARPAPPATAPRPVPSTTSCAASPPASPPFIVRVAGLAAEEAERFSSPGLAAGLDKHERLRRRLEKLRARLIACLHAAIPLAPKLGRGFLLSVKRDCFNGRDLRLHRDHPGWPLLVAAGGPTVDRIVALEAQVEASWQGLVELHRRELDRERSHLVELLDHRGFMRGLALASPELSQNLKRLKARPLHRFGRKEERLALTLLRYASRAALKLSPFASLTRTGVGLVEGTDVAGFELASPGRWRERSTACLHREVLERLLCLLLRCRQVAENLPLRLNDTLEAAAGESYSFVRPARWELDCESQTFRYREEALVKVRLEGPLAAWLITELDGGAKPYGPLLDLLLARSGGTSAERLRAGIDELERIGWLTFVLPWETNEPHLERRILAFLEALPDGGELRPAVAALHWVLDKLRGYSRSDSPLLAIGESARGVEKVFAAALPAAGLGSKIDCTVGSFHFSEDVFLLPEAERPGAQPIARLSRALAEELLRDLDPLIRLSHLASSQHDLLHALAAFADLRWPGRREIGFLEFFRAAQPLFKEYVHYHFTLLSHRPLQAPGFNPFQLAAVRRLSACRREIVRQLAHCLHASGREQHLCREALNRLLDDVPAPYAAGRDFCAFLQPLDAAGRTWVVNAIVDGYGRLSSRHTTAMDGETREYWTSYFAPRSFAELDGERVELVDVSCPGRRTINVHARQTRRCLKLPGESWTCPPEQLLRLKDLRICPRGRESFPVLADADGQRLLPVQRGGMSARLSPTLLKFLAAFGPVELWSSRPVRERRWGAEGAIIERHRIGSVVYLRKRWRFDPRGLLVQLAGLKAPQALQAIDRWRTASGIPRRAFVRAGTGAGPGTGGKPQFIDFSSPSFAQIFAASLRGGARVLEEVLPGPAQFPGGEARWGVEVQLESFAVRHAPPASTPSSS
jgi:hypothetical protein